MEAKGKGSLERFRRPTMNPFLRKSRHFSPNPRTSTTFTSTRIIFIILCKLVSFSICDVILDSDTVTNTDTLESGIILHSIETQKYGDLKWQSYLPAPKKELRKILVSDFENGELFDKISRLSEEKSRQKRDISSEAANEGRYLIQLNIP